MDDRLHTLTQRARKAGAWCSAEESLALRAVEALAAQGPTPESLLTETSADVAPTGELGVRSARVFRQAGTDVYSTFPGGEIALQASAGGALGSWVVRGTIWFQEPGTSAFLDWVEDDHVLVATRVESGQPFEILEFAGRSWHLELRVVGGRTFRLDVSVD